MEPVNRSGFPSPDGGELSYVDGELMHQNIVGKTITDIDWCNGQLVLKLEGKAVPVMDLHIRTAVHSLLYMHVHPDESPTLEDTGQMTVYDVIDSGAAAVPQDSPTASAMEVIPQDSPTASAMESLSTEDVCGQCGHTHSEYHVDGVCFHYDCPNYKKGCNVTTEGQG